LKYFITKRLGKAFQCKKLKETKSNSNSVIS
jgi:hypothetical protein